jgi:hypothetical protein
MAPRARAAAGPSPTGSSPAIASASGPSSSVPARHRPARWLPSIAAAWTLFIWGSRVRNALDDDELSGARLTRALVTSLAFVAVALAVLVADNRRPGSVDRVLGLVAVATTGYWAVRMVVIAVGDHSTSFVVVHLVLAVVSAAAALGAWWLRRPVRA